MKAADFFYEPVYGKMGFSPSCNVVEAELTNLVSNVVKPINNASTEYLEKIIQLCKDEDIDILLTFLPFKASEESRNDAAYVQMIAERECLNYLNPDELLPVINMKTDFKDNSEDNSHFNISGAHKMSYFLGDYLMDNYDIPDRRNDSDYQEWHSYYKAYSDIKLSSLKEQKKLDSYLVGAADKNYVCVVQMKNNVNIDDSIIMNLLNNVGIDIESKWEEKTDLQPDNSLMTFYPSGVDEEISDELWLHNGMYSETIIKEADLYMIIINRESKEILDVSAFMLDTLEKK